MRHHHNPIDETDADDEEDNDYDEETEEDHDEDQDDETIVVGKHFDLMTQKKNQSSMIRAQKQHPLKKVDLEDDDDETQAKIDKNEDPPLSVISSISNKKVKKEIKE